MSQTEPETNQWIQSTNYRQDGTPVSRRIRIPDMDKRIWFTNNGYAEVTLSVATLLSNNIDSIIRVEPPAEPGEYYGEVGDAGEMVIVFPRDDAYHDDLDVNTLTVGGDGPMVGIADGALNVNGEFEVNGLANPLQEDVNAGGHNISGVGAFGAERFEHDYTTSYPHFPNQPVESSGISLSPHPSASNPVLTAADVSDRINVEFVADPFIVYESGTYHMFFEVYHDNDNTGTSVADIGHALSDDGIEWTYNAITDVAEGHDAYPYVFKYGGDWYMTPDNSGDNSFEIWRATNFPLGWVKVDTLLSGTQYTDPTVIRWDGTWFMWSYQNIDANNQYTRLHFSDDLFSGWAEHPSSPVASEKRIQRPAGRPIVRSDAIDIWYMDNRGGYGDMIRSYRVTDLSKTSYTQVELGDSPVLVAENNDGWNSTGVHHLDIITPDGVGSTIVATDGLSEGGEWSIGIYTVQDQATDTARLGVSSAVADQTIPSGGGIDDGRSIYPWTQVDILDIINHDTARIASADTHTISIDQTGYYLVTAMVDWRLDLGSLSPTTGSNGFRLAIRLQDRTHNNELVASDSFTTVIEDMTGFSRTSTVATTNALLEEGAELSIDVFQDSGVDVDIVSNSAQTQLSILKYR